MERVLTSSVAPLRCGWSPQKVDKPFTQSLRAADNLRGAGGWPGRVNIGLFNRYSALALA
jgi:hypothetical protein